MSESEIFGPLDPRRAVTIVSGLPRSGTSLMMQMVEAAGLGVAVGNARQELKQVADRVIGRCDEDGLVPLVEELIARRLT